MKSAEAGVTLPTFAQFWSDGLAEARGTPREPVMLAAFRADPEVQKWLRGPSIWRP